MASILPAWSRCISLAPAPNTISAHIQNAPAIHHVEEEIFRRRPASANQIAQAHAFARAEPDEAARTHSQAMLHRYCGTLLSAANRCLPRMPLTEASNSTAIRMAVCHQGASSRFERREANGISGRICASWPRQLHLIMFVDHFIAGAQAFMTGLEDVVIVSAVRTPIGKFQGSLSDFTAPQLGAIVVREAVKRAGIDPNLVDECIMATFVSAGLGQNPRARPLSAAGFPTVSAP